MELYLSCFNNIIMCNYKVMIQRIGWLFLLLTATILKAQKPVYFFYDPTCMQQMDYERVNIIEDLAHTDYYTPTSSGKQLIFRVQKDLANLNRKMVAEIPIKPYMCADYANVSPALIREINNNRRLAYMVVQMQDQYALYNIYSVATLKTTVKGLVYSDPIYGFNYEKAVSKPEEILNRGKNKECNIFFETETNTACLPTYEFKIISRHVETPIKHLTFVDKLGFQRLYTAQGELRLTRINGQPVAEIIARLCKGARVPKATNHTDKITTRTGIADTVGFSTVEKKLWLSRQSNGLTARNTVQQPKVRGSSKHQSPPRQGIPPTIKRSNTANSTGKKYPNLLPGGIYIVQEKENLYTISGKFNISVERLVALNNLQGFELGLNQPLKVVDDGSIPVQSRNPLVEITDNGTTKTTIHLVEQGDTLYSISKRYGISLKDVYLLNSNLTSDAIDINQRIIVGYQPI